MDSYLVTKRQARRAIDDLLKQVEKLDPNDWADYTVLVAHAIERAARRRDENTPGGGTFFYDMIRRNHQVVMAERLD